MTDFAGRLRIYSESSGFYRIKKTASHIAVTVLRLVLLIGISFVIIYPIVSVICGSFMSLDDLVDITVKYFPKHFTLENYSAAADALNIPHTMITSLIIFTLTSAVQTMSCTMVGYGLARFRFKGNAAIFACVIIQLLIPPDTLMLTRYIQFRYFDLFGLFRLIGAGTLNLTNSFAPLIILGILCMGLKNGLFIFILRQYFKGLPRSNRIPVFLVCGDSDGVVPYPENGEVLAQMYENSGVPFEKVIKPGCGHHPHGLSNLKPLIDFAEKYY